MGTDDRYRIECILRGKRQGRFAGGGATTGWDDHFQRQRFYRRSGAVTCRRHSRTGRYLFDVTAGRRGDFSVSRRDGTVIIPCHGGTGR